MIKDLERDREGNLIGDVNLDIVNISFGLKNFQNYEILQEIEQVGRQGQKFVQMRENTDDYATKEKLDRKKSRLMEKGIKLGEKY